ncbi:MAG: FAD binding domain-containing protein [Erysipelotrichaceae bacterium]|nr:FAD binding domain-containing protein [Erysipelotrichaceae bacterium]
MISFEKYVRAESLQQAYELYQPIKNVVGGGMMWLHLSNAEYDTFIDLCDLGLNEIEEEEDYFKIGSMVTLSQLERNESFKEYFGSAFEDALKHIVGVQFRNCATVGGSICARLGFSDVITLLLPLETEVEFFNRGRMSLEKFLTAPNKRDILKYIYIPKKKRIIRYESVRKTYTDIPVLAICAVKNDDGYLFSVGCRPAIAKLIKPEEEVTFGSNQRGSKEYRQHLYSVLKERMMKEMEEE